MQTDQARVERAGWIPGHVDVVLASLFPGAGEATIKFAHRRYLLTPRAADTMGGGQMTIRSGPDTRPARDAMAMEMAAGGRADAGTHSQA